jgi:hypothetical protein
MVMYSKLLYLCLITISLQTITTVNLNGRCAGDPGVHYLANALIQNQVT